MSWLVVFLSDFCWIVGLLYIVCISILRLDDVVGCYVWWIVLVIFVNVVMLVFECVSWNVVWMMVSVYFFVRL